MTYAITYDEEAKLQLRKLDRPIQARVLKKICQLEREDISSRHLKYGIACFVAQAGNYRIAFKIMEEEKVKRILFVGDHKLYEKWFRDQ